MSPYPRIGGFRPVVWLLWLLVCLVCAIIGAIIWWRILSKAGYSGALGLLMLVPIANLVLLCVLGFGTWPIEQEVRRLRSENLQH